MKKLISLVSLIIAVCSANAQTSVKLTGAVIGTQYSVDYDHNNQKSTTVNTIKNAFDGDLNTYFASYDRSNTWAGLDLGKEHVITKVRYSPRNDTNGPNRVVLGVFEGANREDFMDAVPIYIVKSAVAVGKWGEATVNVTKGFRYLRYMGRNDARCNIAEVEFYGYEGLGDDSRYYTPTKLPLVNIHVENAAEPQDKVNDLVADIQIISERGSERLQAPGTTRLRGNASMDFPKKPYRIKFDKKQNVLDAPAKAKKWTLISNYGDKTLIRNLIAFELSRRVGLEYTPYGRLVDVVFNGEYKGTYQLCDQVEVNPGRVETDELTKKMNSAEEIKGGYLIEVDAYAYDEDNYFYSPKGNPVTVKYPDAEDITIEQNNYIREHFKKMEAAVYAINVTKTDNAFRNYLDVKSFIRHFLVGEFSGNTDTYWSTYMVKYRDDEKFYTGPVWDFDIAFENDYRTFRICDKSDYVFRSGGSYAGDMKFFVNKIIGEVGVQQDIKDLWSVLRYTGVITYESLEEYIDNLVSEVNDSQKLNFTRWSILSQKVHMNPQALGTYQAEVNAVKKYIKDRIEWMDKKLGYDPTDISQITFGAPEDNNYKVYNLAGSLLRITSDINDLQPGIYIIKYGDKAKKVVVK